MKFLNKKAEKQSKKHKYTNTDVMLSNLKSDQDERANGNFIKNNNDTGSFCDDNSCVYGVEQDVDDL